MLLLKNILHLFIVLYEEPTLRHPFGDAHRQYCTEVSRWFPWKRLYQQG